MSSPLLSPIRQRLTRWCPLANSLLVGQPSDWPAGPELDPGQALLACAAIIYQLTTHPSIHAFASNQFPRQTTNRPSDQFGSSQRPGSRIPPQRPSSSPSLSLSLCLCLCLSHSPTDRSAWPHSTFKMEDKIPVQAHSSAPPFPHGGHRPKIRLHHGAS